MRRRLTAFKPTAIAVNGLELVVQTDNAGVSNTDQFTIPVSGSYSYDYNVSTSDGQSFSNQTGALTITFPSAGQYTITISETFPALNMWLADDDTKLVGISNWGDVQFSTMANALRGCTNLASITATDTPQAPTAASWGSMFYDCIGLTSINIDNWDMSAGTSCNQFFRNCSNLVTVSAQNVLLKTNGNTRTDNFFNGCSSLTSIDLSTWDMSGQTRIDGFFNGCSVLSSVNVSGWSLDRCTTYGNVFNACDGLVSIDLSSWTINPALTKSFSSMFISCDALTTINFTGWDTANTTNFSNTFNGNDILANLSDIENFDMSSVTTISGMLRFVGADLDLSGWDITSVTNGSNFWNNQSTLSTANYDAMLIAWEAQLQVAYPGGAGYSGITSIGFGSAKYSVGAAEDARTSLETNFGWIISDGGIVDYGLLVDYPGAAAAYSMRNLINTNTNVIRVRRSSDNVEQDFSAVEVTDGTLTTFTGANDGFVVTMYDQTGNGYHVTQATQAKQPIIVSAGVLVQDASLPAFDFDGSDDELQDSDSAVNQPIVSYITVYNPNVTTLNNRPFGIYSAGARIESSFSQDSDNTLRFDGGFMAGTLTPTTGQKIRYSQRSTTQLYDYINDVQNINTTDTLPNVESIISIGQAAEDGASDFDGKFQEAVVWFSDQLSNRAGIQTNVNNHYNIYP